MRFARWGLVVVAIAGGGLVSARWTLLAQERAARGQGPVRARGEANPNPPAQARDGGLSLQDALLRPFDLPFEQETTLEEVRRYLARTLGVQVILDRAALDRLELVPEDTVQIDLKRVRLKVGLRLLLDQLGMSYKVEAEDNILILTDPEGSDDPARRVLAELKSLHLEMHDLQDSVDDLRDLVEEELGIEPDPPKQGSPLVKLDSKTRRRSSGPKPRLPRTSTRTTISHGVGG